MATRPDKYAGVIRKAVFEGDRLLRRSCFRFAEDFRALRARAGLSQAAIARAIGVDRSAICRVELGDESVSPEIRARAAALLGAEFRMSLFSTGAALIQDALRPRSSADWRWPTKHGQATGSFWVSGSA